MSHALVIGAGPAGLMAADVLAEAGHQVTIADQMPSVGRKFLMAGKSGLNLTKAEDLDRFIAAYGDVPAPFRDAVASFGPDQVTAWATSLGQEVFTGSTGRVFPKVMKASPLLRAWLARLDNLGVTLQRRWRWTGWDAGAVCFETPDGPERLTPDVTVLALGGASWARLGSDGAWREHLSDTAPFKPANCGFALDWTPHMAAHHGSPIKATAFQAGDLQSRGEWVITKRGIEGGGIYMVSAAVRDGAPLTLDLLPDLTTEQVAERLSRQRKKASRKEVLQKALRLPAAKIALVNEWAKSIPVSDPKQVVQAIKHLPVPHRGPLPMDGAISTAGGLRFAGLDDAFMMINRPGVFAAGEMIDWEAPTGGYLITGCLATGRTAGLGAAAWLAQLSQE